MSQGLDNYSEDQYAQFRATTQSVQQTVEAVHEDESFSLDAAELRADINKFVSLMDDLLWDVSVALTEDKALVSVAEMSTSEALRQANNVESFIIDKCGLPKSLPGDEETFGTLPFPYIPVPLATDPPTGPVNQQSENVAIGNMVGTLFGLTLSEEQVECIGSELQNVVDVSSAESNSAQYASQYQAAFDACGVMFDLPRD
jgi:hypothetical protein